MNGAGRKEGESSIYELVSRLFDDALDEKERTELADRLRRDASARRIYRRMTELEAELIWLGRGGIRRFTFPTATTETPRRPTFTVGRIASALLLAASVLSLLFAVYPSQQGGLRGPPIVLERTEQEKREPIAELLDTDQCVWSACDSPTSVDSLLYPGSMRLDSGRATLRFRSGAVLSMLGPIAIELLSDRSAELLRGRISVRIDKPIAGFHIRTPAGRIDDVGTTFGVYVSKSGETEIHVLEGQVRVTDAGDESKETRTIRVGKAQRFGLPADGKWVEIECSPEAYRRLFPDSLAPAEPRWKLLYEDSFEGAELDHDRWLTRLVPFGESDPKVLAEDGHVRFVDRGYLIFKQPLDLAQVRGVRVAGRWTIISPRDQPEVVLRTDSVPAAPYGDVARGISCTMLLADGEATLAIVPRSNDHSIKDRLPFARIPVQIGDTFNFEIVDTIDTITFRVWDANNGEATAQIQGEVLGHLHYHGLCFHNRNRQRWPMHLTMGYVRVDVLQTPAEPSVANP